MEGKVIGMLVAFVLIACFAGALTYNEGIESSRHDLDEVLMTRTNLRSSLSGKLELRNSVKAKLDTLKAQIESHSALTESRQQLGTEIATLEEDLRKVEARFVKAVQERRASSMGTAWADITLPTGQVLQKVTLQKFGDDEVTLAHSGGMARISQSDLPQDMRERFRYGLPPMVPRSKRGASPPALAPATKSPTAASPSPQSAVDEKAASHEAIMQKVYILQAQISNLEKTRSDWIKRASDHNLLLRSAQERGRPSYTHGVNATAADQQAAAAEAQINKLQSEITTLRSKIN